MSRPSGHETRETRVRLLREVVHLFVRGTRSFGLGWRQRYAHRLALPALRGQPGSLLSESQSDGTRGPTGCGRTLSV